MTAAAPRADTIEIPDWVPQSARLYLRHTGAGESLRSLARGSGLNASTVLRHVRKFETRREDPLIDHALARLANAPLPNIPTTTANLRKDNPMSAPIRPSQFAPDQALIRREARRILRRLCEAGAMLVVAPDMDKAAVLKSAPDGGTARTAVTERRVAEAFALKEWIACRSQGRVNLYEITATGRAALKRLLAETDTSNGFAEAPMPFAAQHRVWGEKFVGTAAGEEPRRVRYNLAESPVTVLGRRREKDGTAFLAADLVAAAERLREDFELAQMGPRIAQNWEKFLTGSDRGGFRPGTGIAEGPAGARERVAAALRDLGPGLGDVVLRCCCFLEGLEAAERRMGWSARSGKIVLRIALQRLKRHYAETGLGSPLIG